MCNVNLAGVSAPDCVTANNRFCHAFLYSLCSYFIIPMLLCVAITVHVAIANIAYLTVRRGAFRILNVHDRALLFVVA